MLTEFILQKIKPNAQGIEQHNPNRAVRHSSKARGGLQCTLDF